MKILFVTYGTAKAPATRYRVAQCLPHFEERGVACELFSAISSFSTDLMIASPDFGPARKGAYYLYVFLERIARFFRILAVSKKFDIIFLQRATFPLRLEVLLKAFNGNIVFDIDDAIYLTDKQDGSIVTLAKKFVKEREVVNILKVSRVAIVENEYIKDFVSRYCADTVKIPGPIDTDRFFAKVQKSSKDTVIGWIGSPATTSYLHMLDGVFAAVKKRHASVRFRFIGLGRYENSTVEIEGAAWRYDREVEELQGFDIGIMPMPDDEWTRGKLGCKMLQYMSVAIPAVVSYTPTNAEIIEDGVNGFFANTESEWTEKLCRLIEDGSLRAEVGQRGRKTVIDKCSLSANVGRYLDVFKRLSGHD